MAKLRAKFNTELTSCTERELRPSSVKLSRSSRNLSRSPSCTYLRLEDETRGSRGMSRPNRGCARWAERERVSSWARVLWDNSVSKGTCGLSSFSGGPRASTGCHCSDTKGTTSSKLLCSVPVIRVISRCSDGDHGRSFCCELTTASPAPLQL